MKILDFREKMEWKNVDWEKNATMRKLQKKYKVF